MMGIIKWIIKKFKCTSSCAYNIDDFSNDLCDVDLSKYQLKVGDLLAIQKIVDKRPSIYKYKHSKNISIEI
jgi:hypothetical protein